LNIFILKLDPPSLLSSQFNYVDNFTQYDPQENSNNQEEIDYRDDNSTCSETSTTKLAISTAQIFRDIVVDKRGKIICQNARSLHCDKLNEKVNKKKKGQKSRQADTIKKANDAVDCEVYCDQQKNGLTGSKIELLIVVGEYDNINQLVFHGSKKLRHLNTSTEEAFLSTDCPPRHKMQKINNCINTADDVMSSSPKYTLKNFHPQTQR
jgi:hypothetical protein